jgi:hypothetical protein
MQFFFADDSRQNKPSRPGMRPLVATGGVSLPAASIRGVESELNELCASFGFPPREPFKWSPGPELWMRANLTGARRMDFLLGALQVVQRAEAAVIVVLEDTMARPATRALHPEQDVTTLLLERVENYFRAVGSDGVVIVDRPGGDRRAEDAFLLDCVDTLAHGTDYVKPERIALNVLSAHSQLTRLLQMADVVTSCTTAAVAGEQVFAPPVFDLVRQLFATDGGRVGGVGLKIHPDLRYVNLYHWLVGDEYLRRSNFGEPLPMEGRPYFSGPFEP